MSNVLILLVLLRRQKPKPSKTGLWWVTDIMKKTLI